MPISVLHDRCNTDIGSKLQGESCVLNVVRKKER